jgi:perosamine synthetase
MIRLLPPVAPQLTGQALVDGVKSVLDGASAVDSLADAIADYVGAHRAFLASSGRAALYLVLKALSQRSSFRREVVLPAYTCPSLVMVVRKVGLEVRLCDISPHTLGFDREQLSGVLSERTLAVVLVHLFGIPQEVQDVVALASKVGAMVIEDAAQAMGARLNGRTVGTWGHIGLTSLGPGKALSTGGGGVVLVNDDERCEILSQIWQGLPPCSVGASFLALARTCFFSLLFRPTCWRLVSLLGLDRIGDRESSWGFRVLGLTSGQAGIGRNLLGQLDTVNAARRVRAAEIVAALNGLDIVRFPDIPGGAEPIYVRLPVLAASESCRDRILVVLRSQGIGAGRMYGRSLPAIFPGLADAFHPGAQTVAERLFTLPTHGFVRACDIAIITAVAARVAEEFETSSHRGSVR